MKSGRAERRAPVTLAVSAGDPQGVGPEVTIDALRLSPPDGRRWRVILAGDANRLEELWQARLPRYPDEGPLVLLDRPFEDDGAPGPSSAGGRAAFAALESSVELVEAREASALVTAPLSKEAVSLEHSGFIGHTDWLAERFGRDAVMLLAADGVRVFLVTDHLPVSRVSASITTERFGFVLRQAREALIHDFGVEAPRLAILGLNPHAGEGGRLGAEEQEVMQPVIERLGGPPAGFHGPFPADSFFAGARAENFDGVVAAYHDQGLIPLKARSFNRAVNITIGLPLIRTSPDHGTAFDIAGQGKADPGSMRLALECALEMVERRSTAL